MQTIFEVFKGLFFICSIFVALLYAIGRAVLNSSAYDMALTVLLPGYLLLAGLMIGYILANIQAAKYDRYPEYLQNIYKRGMVVGIVVGIVFAGIYLGLSYTGIIAI